MCDFTINLQDRYFRVFIQLTGQKLWNEPIIALTRFIGSFKPFYLRVSFAPNSEKGNVKEPKYLNIYQIISRFGNVGMLGDLFNNILVVDFP